MQIVGFGRDVPLTLQEGKRPIHSRQQSAQHLTIQLTLLHTYLNREPLQKYIDE